MRWATAPQSFAPSQALASNLGMTTTAEGVGVLTCVIGPHDRSSSTMSYTDDAYRGTFAAVPKRCPSKAANTERTRRGRLVFLVPMRPAEG
jgi:hypothetical protein